MNQHPAETIELAEGIAEALVAHARAASPNECCGLLVGSARRIDECVPTANIDSNPSRFQVDPAAHIAVNRRLRGSGRAVLGVYHSHPRGPSGPSPTDVAEAAYREFVHVIVSDFESGRPQIRAFRIAEGVVIPIALIEGPERRSS